MLAVACRSLARLMLAATFGVWAGAASAVEPAQPEVAPAGAFVPSRLEAAYSARAGLPLRQFGYELFSHGTGTPGGAVAGVAPVGGVQGGYVLGVGDDLQVVLRSTQRSGTKRYTVDSQGLLLVDDLAPVPAAGRTLAEVREELRGAARAAFPDADLFLSLFELRRIHVLVVGEVAHPGRYALTSLGTALDALYAAGGVTSAGSLRRISLARAGAPAGAIDLYDILQAGGRGGDLRLADGDRLVVPPLGPTLAVAGAVRRPAIY
ncbi:MAG: SLBB domain-containing protein, partial [Rhodospirillaceae bacterium]